MLSTFRSDPGIETYGRGYAWALVLFFTTASVLLNGAHAVLGMAGASPWARIWAVLTAILFPLAVLAETHFLVNLIREWDTRARWIAVLRLVCIAAVLVVAYIAFVRSFYALGDMAALMGIPDEDWWMLPASIDAMIILATLGVVISEGQMALDRDEVALDQSVPTASLTIASQVASDRELVTIDAERVTVADQVVTDQSSTADQTDGLAGPRTNSADQSENVEVSSVTIDLEPVTDQVGELVCDHEDRADQVVTDQSSITDQDDQTGPLTTDRSAWSAALDHSVVSGLAELVRDELGTDVAADVIERALALTLTGVSRRKVAEQVGVGSHNTVKRWTDVARDLDPSYAARLDGKVGLVAVN